MTGKDFDDFENNDFIVIDDIVSLGKNIELEINNKGVEELLQNHEHELITEQLQMQL